MEIKKLADVVTWADNWIKELKDGLTEEEFENDKEVKEFETVKKVVLESMERHAVYTNALNNDIADKAAKIDLLEKEIEGRKEGYMALKVLMDTKYISIDEHNKIVDQYKDLADGLNKDVKYWKEAFETQSVELADCKVKIRHQKENLDGINKTLEIRTKENESLIKVRNNQEKEIEAHESENARLTEKIKELKTQVKNLEKELEKTSTCKDLDLKGHQSRETALVNALADKDNEIKDLKGTIEYYKNQERIRTDQLRATERKVDALWKENERLKKDSKNKSEMIRKAYTRYVDEACKDIEEIMNECYKNITKDNTGYLGFREYTLRALENTKGDAKEAKEYICNAADVIIYDKKAKERRKEEETEVKGVGRTNSGRYPWGAKVNDIPCGEDAIE